MNLIKKLLKKFDWKNLLLLFISLFISLIIAELMLRFFWCNGKNEKVEYQSAPFLTQNKYWKVWHYPNVEVIHKKVCFEAVYKTNSLGIKDEEVDFSKPRIVLLGDSFVEGMGNNNNDTVSYQMESLLNNKYDVVPLGTSGGFGNVEEVSLYENLGRFLKPKIVIFFFLNYNDLYDNLEAIKLGLVSKDGKNLTYPRVDNFDTIKNYIQSQNPTGIKKLTSSNFCLPKFWEYMKLVLSAKLQEMFNTRINFRKKLASVYMPEENENIKLGWTIVKTSLQRLKELCDRNNVKLIVVQIADPFQLDDNWVKAMELKLFAKLDPLYPNKKLKNICQKLNIEYISMYNFFEKYKKEYNLKYPYFSFSCDRHYSPLGHRLMAQFIVNYLKEKRYLEAK